MPERFESEVLRKVRYINTLTLMSILVILLICVLAISTAELVSNAVFSRLKCVPQPVYSAACTPASVEHYTTS